MNVYVHEQTLTDQSKVYDVVIRDTRYDNHVRLPCVTKAGAEALAVGLAGLIEAHTTMFVEVA
jgi:hypothetical protein